MASAELNRYFPDVTAIASPDPTVACLFNAEIGGYYMAAELSLRALNLDGFYEGTIFHRVVANFVIQGGGYTPQSESVDPTPKPGLRGAVVNESGNGLSNLRMTIAMARTNDPHSADSQFYINLGDNIALDPKPTRWGYAVFGVVTEGMEVVDDIGNRATLNSGQFQNMPEAPIIIERVVVVGSDGG